ncbi:hypothetical protein [uncultured Bosea sp.]|uniref:hypothetical protein n=1 Tax=uncultured Bosea sp. TaxID=211457 RepID=UPI0025E2C168|nr:hypothetical protein [uncultured Bosea sp.]
MKRVIPGLAVILPLLLASAGSHAAQVTRSGTAVTVRGSIGPGDDLEFEKVAPQGSYRTVTLSSNGAGEGGLPAAVAMARNIKATGATTIVNASGNICGSACTLLFVAGAQRIYAGGDRIVEGVRSKGQSGLGFHQARSPKGTALMASVYSEMGVPAGAELSRQSPFGTFYYVSGATAMSTGVATSLKRP